MDIPLEKCDTDNIKKMIRLRKKNYPICKDGIQDTIIIPDFNRFNNERLKFLGIAICKFLTVEHVYTHFPDAEPHQMTLSVHAILDHSDICIQHAIEELKIKDYVLHKSSSPNSSLPDCLFALIGAIFVDSGYNFSALVNDANSSNIVSKYILSTFDKERHMHPDYIRSPVKHYTQHLCQLVFGQVPKFEFIQNEELKNESNDQIDWIYKCTISCQDLILAEHKGMNRKLVEREACHIAIKELSTRTGNNESENSLNDT
jgi:ribonuclease-3